MIVGFNLVDVHYRGAMRCYPDPLKAEQHDQRGKTRIRY
jgi:hypothetical protein